MHNPKPTFQHWQSCIIAECAESWDSHRGLLKIRQCLFLYLKVALLLPQRWEIGQDFFPSLIYFNGTGFYNLGVSSTDVGRFGSLKWN